MIGSERIATTILDQAGSRIIGTIVDDKVMDAIYKQKAPSYVGTLNIFDRPYGVHYSPLISDDRIIGMLFTGVDISSLLDSRSSMNRWIFFASVLGLGASIVFIVSSRTFARKYLHTVQELSEKTTSLNIMEKMLESIEAQILITDPKTDAIIFINERMKEAFYLKDSVIDKKCWQIFQKDTTERCDFCPKKQTEIFNGKPIVWEERNSITGRHYRIISRIIDWPNGSKVYLQERDDVTELIDSIARIREMDERMQLMLNTSPNGIVFFDSNYTCLDCNQEVLNMFGLSDKEEYCHKFTKYSPLYQPNGELSEDARRKHIALAFEKGYNHIEWMHQKTCGELVPCEIVLVRSKYQGKDVVIAHMHDLRELKAAITHMRESDEYAQLMLDATPLSINLWDKVFNLMQCNQEAANLVGLSSKLEYVNRFTDFSPELQPCGRRSDELRIEYIKKAFQEGSSRFEWMHQNINGEQLPCDILAVRVKHRGDFVVAGYTRDMREHKAYLAEINKTQNNLYAARDAAEAASHAKSMFLANMSHEIRTPMNAIIGFSELAQDGDNPAKTREYLTKITENAEWLLQIINDILDVSKVEAGKMKLEQVPFDLHDIFVHCRALILPRADEKGISLYCYAEPSIGKKMLGDPLKLRQVILNLLYNAVKFTNIGIVKLFAAIVKSDEDSATIHFEIKDSGIGMSSEQIASLFKPFMQADASITRKYGGTGLGLAISKNLIELMGGKLDVESAVGVGSKFCFELTFKTINSTAEVSSQKTAHSWLEKPSFTGEVLVFEDNEMNQQVICDHLARVGLMVHVASNGREGVDLLKKRMQSHKKPFDLILMDIHMPEMDGLEAASKITELETGIPIVAMTANIMSNEVELYKSHGIPDCVCKPFTSQELWNCLLKYLTPVSLSSVDKHSMSEEDIALQSHLKTNFVKSNQTIFHEISKAVEQDEIKLAHRLVHTLKNNAGQIGKKRLQDAAAVVESKLTGEKKSLKPIEMSLLEAELKVVLAELAHLQPEAITQNNATDTDRKKLLDVMEQLETMLENRNPECIRLLDGIRTIPGTEDIIWQIEDFEFKLALASLSKFKNDWV